MDLKYYLDTNMCIYFLKGKHINLLNKIKNYHHGEIKIASIVKAELLYGANKSQKKEENIELVNKFLLPFEIINFDDTSSVIYADIRANSEKRGEIIGPNDLIIASTIQANGGILVTNNTNDFKRINNLKVENWVNECGLSCW